MLKLHVTMSTDYDETTNEFVNNAFELELEHSLLAVSKWESKYEKPFLADNDKSTEEIQDYIRIMTLTPNVSDEVYSKLSTDNIEEINNYITSKQSATWFRENPDDKKRRPQEMITAELIYYWMISYRIPMETETWHLNKLLTLIRVFNVKSEKPKKMSQSQIAARNRQLNEERRKKFNTTG